MLMAARGDDAIGFVSWFEIKSGFQSSCWMIGIAFAPEARGHGYGPKRSGSWHVTCSCICG